MPTPRCIGTTNYVNLFTAYPFFWPALFHNLIWLAWLMFIATPIGILLAVLLDRAARGYAVLPDGVLPAGRALAGGHRDHLEAACTRPSRGSSTTCSAGPRNNNLIDWLGDPSLNLWAALVAASWRHVGYIMVLYLAGLKAFDPTLREAAKVDGANERQTFFRVVFPVMSADQRRDRRDHDDRGAAGVRHRLHHQPRQERARAAVHADHQQRISESNRLGFGSAIAVVLLVISLGPIIAFLTRMMREDRR